jgi:nucleotide-binding universal stress UspA family protein
MCLSLLVPLDRSTFAEQALPLALSIARRANARLDLVEKHALYALEDPHAGWARFDPEQDAKWKQKEGLYLDATARWVASVAPVTATTALLSGSALGPDLVADSILERARATGADLIVMATHGRGLLRRFGVGSVADELLRRACVPVLLVRGGDKAAGLVPEPTLDNILIALDGSPLAEQVLEPALDLARLTEAQCCLLRVVEPHSSSDHARGALPERAAAEGYLARIGARLREQGLVVRTRVVVARHAAEAIQEEAEAQASNLIALATHGRGGLKRLLLGSVAYSLVHGAASPILVYRPTRTGP